MALAEERLLDVSQLSFEALKSARIREQPFLWCALRDFLGRPETLAQTYPETGYRRFRRDGGSDKLYNFEQRELVSADGEAQDVSDLHPEWQGLIAALRSATYREAVGWLMGVNLATARPAIGLYRYCAPGDWVSPHLDKAAKALTHVFFFNEHWNRDWGAQFLALNSSDISDVAAEVEPSVRNSVVLKPGQDSWHAVRPLSGPVCRRSLQVEFWKA